MELEPLYSRYRNRSWGNFDSEITGSVENAVANNAYPCVCVRGRIEFTVRSRQVDSGSRLFVRILINGANGEHAHGAFPMSFRDENRSARASISFE